MKAPRHLIPIPLLHFSISPFMQPQDHKYRHNESRAACLFDWRLTILFFSMKSSGILVRLLAHHTSAWALAVVEGTGSSMQADGGEKCMIFLWQQSIVITAEINYKTAPLLMCRKLRGGWTWALQQDCRSLTSGKKQAKISLAALPIKQCLFPAWGKVIFKHAHFNEHNVEKAAVVQLGKQWGVMQE